MKKLVILSLCLFMTLTVRSQSWRAAADSLIVNHVLANAIGKVDIYVFPEPLTSTDSITLYDGSKIPIPYSNCYCYFIDIMPSANWSHPCKYCFVNASLRHTSVSANMPPARDDIIGLSLYA